jgi:hypothetical protein
MDKSKDAPLAPRGAKDDVSAFVEAARRTPAPTQGTRGRLIFALDATMSRQPTWDLAQALQGKMFQVAAGLGGLDVQLVYFRGLNECRASNFVSGGQGLAELMGRIQVRGGETQIRKVLVHARDEAKRAKVGALVFVGDAMEENVDRLAKLAGELGLLGTPVFVFHEGGDRNAGAAFRQIAKLSRGAYLSFDTASADRLKELLAAVAVYAAGGYRALADYSAKKGGEIRLLTAQLQG